MAETGLVLRLWDYYPEREFEGAEGRQLIGPVDALGRPQVKYDDALPLWGEATNIQAAGAKLRFPYDGLYEPIGGYLVTQIDDSLAEHALLDEQFVLKLSDAKRIIYQETWWLQVELTTNWPQFAGQAIMNAFYRLMWELVEFFTGGRSLPIEFFIDEILRGMGLLNIRREIQRTQKRCIERFERQVLQQRGEDYRTAFFHRMKWLRRNED